MSDERAVTLLDELIDLGPVARTARLELLEREDPALAATLRRMLAADAATSGVLDHAFAQGTAPQLPPPDRSGQHIGAYRLVARIGRGGMGEVYRAERDAGGYAQTVAVKLLRRGVDSEDIVRRFVQERRILARLEHPGIARLIDGGLSADGLPWLAMELVDGKPITVHAQSLALGLRQRIELLIAVCEALDYAHRRLIVHRDLKPSNVLVGADGAPRLLDFGIAKLLDQPEGETLTGTGVRVLSPAYAAPEQIAGEPVGIATDVYALGLLLYEMLTGELPHGRRDGARSILSRDLVTEAERPSASVRRTIGADTTIAARALEGDLDTIALKALAHEPDRRYASAAALAEDLRRHLAGRPIAARPDTLSYRMGKFVRRNRGGVALGALAALGIMTAMVVALWQAGVARREAAAAVESASRTKRVKDFMMETFVHADPLRSRSDAPKTVAQAVDDAIARVDSDLGDDPKLQVDLLDDFGEIRTGQGRFDDALELFERALAQAERVYGPDHPAVAESLLNRASIDFYSERVASAAPFSERAVVILEKHLDTDPLALVNALGALSIVRYAQGRREDALALTGRALEIQRQFGKPDDPNLNAALHNHGTHLIHMGRYAEAEPLVREAIALREQSLGADNPVLEHSLSSLSDILYRKGDIVQSLAIDERRLRMARKAFPGPNAWKANVLTDMGRLFLDVGRVQEGFAFLDEAIAIYTTLDSMEVLAPLRFVAIGKHREGDDAGALATVEAAWQVCQPKPLDRPACALVRATRAGMLARQGQAAQALREADAALADLRDLGMAGTPDAAQAMESRAAALAALGQQAEAEATQAEALAIYVRTFGEAHPETARVRDTLGKLREAAGASR